MTKSEQGPPISTLWLDVTLLLECDLDKPTGIPRTTIELFRAWRRHPSLRFRLCRLDMVQQAYIEVPPERVLASSGVPEKRLPVPEESDLTRANLKSRALAVLRTGFRTLPQALRLLIGPGMVVKRIKELFQRIGFLVGTSPTSAGPIDPSKLPLALGPGDLVVSLGGAWNHPGSATTCRQLREQMGFRCVHLIYDLIPIKFPQLFREDFPEEFDAWLMETFPAVDLVLTISRHTRRDVLEFCAQRNLPAPACEVIRLGELISQDDASDAPPAIDSFDPARPFVLSVGTIEIRKNHVLLYYAWRRLLEQHGKSIPQLVLVGAPGWLTQEVHYQIEHDPLTRGHIVLLHRCDDQQLSWLYRHCLFTMYPSHYEGWGLPVAESLALGKYCIASDTSSIPEIGGDLVGLHDPSDLPGCLRLVEVALDPTALAAREERIRRGYHRTTWDETGRQLLRHIETHFGPVLPRLAKIA